MSFMDDQTHHSSPLAPLEPLPEVSVQRRISRLARSALALFPLGMAWLLLALWKVGFTARAWHDASRDTDAFFSMLALFTPPLVIGLSGTLMASAALFKPRITRALPITGLLLNLTVTIAALTAIVVALLADRIFA